MSPLKEALGKRRIEGLMGSTSESPKTLPKKLKANKASDLKTTVVKKARVLVQENSQLQLSFNLPEFVIVDNLGVDFDEQELEKWHLEYENEEIAHWAYFNAAKFVEEAHQSFYYYQKTFFAKIGIINPGIKWFMRAKMIDWMMEVSSEFALRRETLYNAVLIADCMLGVTQNFQIDRFQLLGITSMFIASKIEEIISPSIENFSFTANNAYSLEDIQMMEIEICKSLDWKLKGTSINTVLGILTEEWDNLLRTHEEDNQRLYFRKQTKQSYFSFCRLTQLLDSILCHPIVLKLTPILLVSAAIKSVIFEVDHDRGNLDHFFKEWMDRIGFLEQLDNLEIAAGFVQQFLDIQTNFEAPPAMRINGDHVVKGHYEDFLSLQNYNSSISEFYKELDIE